MVVAQVVGWQVFDDDALQLLDFLVHLAMVLRESLNVIVGIGIPREQRLHVWEHHFLLILHVRADGMGVFVVEFEDEAGEVVFRIQGIHEFLSDERELEVKVIGV